MNESSYFLPSGNKEGLQKKSFRSALACSNALQSREMVHWQYVYDSGILHQPFNWLKKKKNFPPCRPKKFRGSPFSSHCSHALRRAGPGGVYISLRLQNIASNSCLMKVEIVSKDSAHLKSALAN